MVAHNEIQCTVYNIVQCTPNTVTWTTRTPVPLTPIIPSATYSCTHVEQNKNSAQINNGLLSHMNSIKKC